VAPEIEAHQHRLRSPIAAIVGLAEASLQRDDLDQDLVAHLRAIRELALDALGEAQRSAASRDRNR
jgi:signal transduction histidine kinase